MSNKNNDLQVDKKLYRHVLKGLGFYKYQQERDPTFREMMKFVELANYNLVPVSNMEGKVQRVIDELEELNVCNRMPDGKISLYECPCSTPISHRQNSFYFGRYTASTAQSFGLVAQLEAIPSPSVLHNELNLNEALGETENESQGNVETVQAEIENPENGDEAENTGQGTETDQNQSEEILESLNPIQSNDSNQNVGAPQNSGPSMSSGSSHVTEDNDDEQNQGESKFNIMFM